MTTYRLPEVLGGGEFENLVEFLTKTSNQWRSRFDIPGVGLVDVPREALTEVVTLPEEPGPGAVVLDRDLRAWQYVGDGRGDWCCTVDDLGADWEELNREHGPLTRLVPAPVVEPVTLPWTDGPVSIGFAPRGLGVGSPHTVVVGVRSHLAHITAGRARNMARALNAATDAAEASHVG